MYLYFNYLFSQVSIAIALAAFVAVALADSQYAKPAYEAKPAYQTYDYVKLLRHIHQLFQIINQCSFLQAPSPYSFAYAVKDEPSYNDFGHSETSDGKAVTGSYSVVLPDGRKQIVTYKVDAYSGYVAEVKYEGVAKYPEYKAYAAPAAYTAKY